MRVIGLCLIVMYSAIMQVVAQSDLSSQKGAWIGLKTNALYWGTVTPNVGAELRLATHWTAQVELGLNPFTGKQHDGSYGKSIKHFRLQPEFRYWFCEVFDGHFVGLHFPYWIYNVSGIKLLGTQDERHQGWGTGVGVSYGYDWPIHKHWNLEATFGVGYLYLNSERYPCTNCGEQIGSKKKHYLGPSQAAINLIYLF